MIIGIAGPYSANTEEQRQKNLDALNIAAAMVLQKGHTPIVGVNAALPVLKHASVADEYLAIMNISMAVIDSCDAILLTAESPGALREKEMVQAKGLPVFYSIEVILFARWLILRYHI